MTSDIVATTPPMGRQPACIQVEARQFDRKPRLAVLRHAMSVRLQAAHRVRRFIRLGFGLG
jgi:hypothetical protein